MFRVKYKNKKAWCLLWEKAYDVTAFGQEVSEWRSRHEGVPPRNGANSLRSNSTCDVMNEKAMEHRLEGSLPEAGHAPSPTSDV